MRGKEIFNMSEVFNNNEFTSEPSQQSSNSYPYSFEQPFDAQQQPFAAQPGRSSRCFWPARLWAAAPASARQR